MIRKIKQAIEKRKISKLLEILDRKGTFMKNYDGIPREDEEITILSGINVFYHLGAKTEDEFVREMSLNNYVLYNHPDLQRDDLKQHRRATTWFLQSRSFRERMLNFYFDCVLPFASKMSFFEINKLYKNFHKKYKIR